MTRLILCATTLPALLTVALMADAPSLKYPSTRKGDVVEKLHGVEVPDPYRWLEDDVRESKDVADWVKAQNQVTFAHLESIPARKKIRDRLSELWNYPRYSIPFREGKRYFFSKNTGLQNQSVLHVLEKLDGEPRLLLDPNTWSKDGTRALSALSVSPSGKHLAYAVSEAGSDWKTWYVLNVDTGNKLDDVLKWTKFTQAAWTPDGKGFYYSRFDEPRAGQTFQTVNLNQKVYFHRLGTSQAEDELVHRQPDEPTWVFHSDVTDDGKYLVLSARKGTDARNRVFFRELGQPDAKFKELINHFEDEYSLLGNEGSTLFFKTTQAAPRGRIIGIDVHKPERASWKEIVPQQTEAIDEVNLVGDQFIVRFLKDARSQVKLYGMDGKLIRELELPGLCTAAGFEGKRRDSETFYSVTSFATPTATYRLDLKTGKSELFRRSEVKFDPEAYEVKQVFYRSKDGTRVPMFLAHRKGIKLDGNNPTLLYGYGGFNIAITPQFSVSRLVWMEQGGVFAVANLRGGGEYGEEWHKAGTKLSKQNVFDDFIAAAEHLIREKYTQPGRLGIQGRSNGGLLVGACMIQRPDLFGACLPGVGVMDMLRFHKFTAGRYWVDDYGSPDNPREFKALHAYSPYHNLKNGVKYPPTLVTTADTDDRVVPGHSFKFLARLQECQAGSAPVLARIETAAGHGSGKPTAKLIEEAADEMAFLVRHLGVEAK